MDSTFSYLRTHAVELGSRILETYPPLQSTKDPVAPSLATLLRKALPAQALAITGTAKYLRTAKAARIVAECGAGKTYVALGTIHVLADGRPSTTLVPVAATPLRCRKFGGTCSTPLPFACKIVIHERLLLLETRTALRRSLGATRNQSWAKVRCIGRSDCKALSKVESTRAGTRILGEESGWANLETDAPTAVQESASNCLPKTCPSPKASG